MIVVGLLLAMAPVGALYIMQACKQADPLRTATNV